ncbi:enoyl-CoA hydratase [Salimicrobium jeotgali]|uniref:Enoyl-CoA hydratase n=1 Tax=Salimicrobium jeotgali TaxID=1230341 RepID=K2GLS0_9BACI|nr:enoyl-CoA hydratase [Salimicrobium jeotgali]AKG05358.1 enoyl-CoA hydratase [Salimicrobium jeotgali]EKE31364.1 enoyl-CoA hydratase [Salimicrobium jeotgali]MBM7696974.1 2-(1,2-epoxy-1,2-dihydrophenyl)acetyl-CoA isomerase [Salimicrobium jeotgali]
MTIEGNEHVLAETKEGVLYLTMNRPDSLNAFSPTMMQGLKGALGKAQNDADVRTVVLSGAGRAFSAGGDVKTMGDNAPLDIYDHIGELNELILTMKDLDKPIVAAVHGFAAGAGFNLALACDIILAAEDTNFILSFSKVGLVSDGGGHYFLSKLIGPYRTKELLFSAEPVSVTKAQELGIVNHVYRQEEMQQKVHEFAVKLASGPAVAYGFMKKIVDQALDADLATILERERTTQATMVSTEDHKEGVQAFKEKRTPKFKGN